VAQSFRNAYGSFVLDSGCPIAARNRKELFYQEGVRSVGVDTFVARSRVSKSSLYHTIGLSLQRTN
jgi:hypothetical protein